MSLYLINRYYLIRVSYTGTCGQDPMLLPFFFFFLRCCNIYNKYNQTVVSIYAEFLT